MAKQTRKGSELAKRPIPSAMRKALGGRRAARRALRAIRSEQFDDEPFDPELLTPEETDRETREATE